MIKSSNFYRLVHVDTNRARYTNTFDSLSEFGSNMFHFFQIIYWTLRLVLRIRYIKNKKMKYITFYNTMMALFTIGLILTFTWEYLDITYSKQ